MVRYHRQLLQYQTPEGYDAYGNLIVEENTGKEQQQPPLKKATTDHFFQQGLDTSKITVLGSNTASASSYATLSSSSLTTCGFSELFYELTKFRIVHGHCRVPTKRNAHGMLGKWIERLRKEYKKLKAGGGGTNVAAAPVPDAVR